MTEYDDDEKMSIPAAIFIAVVILCCMKIIVVAIEDYTDERDTEKMQPYAELTENIKETK